MLSYLLNGIVFLAALNTHPPIVYPAKGIAPYEQAGRPDVAENYRAEMLVPTARVIKYNGRDVTTARHGDEFFATPFAALLFAIVAAHLSIRLLSHDSLKNALGNWAVLPILAWTALFLMGLADYTAMYTINSLDERERYLGILAALYFFPLLIWTAAAALTVSVQSARGCIRPDLETRPFYLRPLPARWVALQGSRFFETRVIRSLVLLGMFAVANFSFEYISYPDPDRAGFQQGMYVLTSGSYSFLYIAGTLLGLAMLFASLGCNSFQKLVGLICVLFWGPVSLVIVLFFRALSCWGGP